jgi:hypothetical protein
MDVGSTHVLVVHGNDVSVVAADVSLLVLVGALQSRQIVHICILTVTLAAVDTRQLFQIYVVHVLWRPEIGQDLLHVLLLIVIRARAGAVSTRSTGALVLQGSMRSLDAHLPQITRCYEIEAEFARFYKLDIAVAAVTRRSLTTYLLLSGHDGGVVARTSRARLAVLHVAHGALVLAALHLWHHLILTCIYVKGNVRQYSDHEWMKINGSSSRTFELVPQVADV